MSENKQELLYLDPNDVVVDPNKNIRNDDNYGEEDFEELKESIKTQGVKQPVYVFQNGDEQYEIAHGFRRGLAIQILLEEGVDLLPIPAILTEENAVEQLLDHLILNYGRPLTQLEQSSILQSLSNNGLSNKDISEKTGIQYQKVTYLVRFRNEAADALIEEIKNDNISFTVALELLRVAGQDIENQNNVLNRCRQKAKLNGNEKITMKDITDLKYEIEDKDNSETYKNENDDKIEKEPDASKSDGKVTVETETEEEDDIEDMPSQKVSNEVSTDNDIDDEYDEDEADYVWEFVQYVRSNKSKISSSAGFFDINKFLNTVEYIQNNIDDKTYQQLFKEIFMDNDS